MTFSARSLLIENRKHMSNVLFKSEIFKSKIYPCNCYFLFFFDYGTRTQDLPHGDVGICCISQLHYQPWNFCFHSSPVCVCVVWCIACVCICVPMQRPEKNSDIYLYCSLSYSLEAISLGLELVCGQWALEGLLSRPPPYPQC